MITEERFVPEHWPEIRPQGGVSVPAEPRKEFLERLASQDFATTVRDDGRVVAFFGAVVYWTNRVECWAVLDRDSIRAFIGIHRIAQRTLDAAPYRRIEAVVECPFIQGHRWVRMLGFQQEAARMRAYYPDGRDVSLYARIREGR